MYLIVECIKHKYQYQIKENNLLVETTDLLNINEIIQKNYQFKKIIIKPNCFLLFKTDLPLLSSKKIKQYTEELINKIYNDQYHICFQIKHKTKNKIHIISFLIEKKIINNLTTYTKNISFLIERKKNKQNKIIISDNYIIIKVNNDLEIINRSLYTNKQLINNLDLYFYGINYNKTLKLINETNDLEIEKELINILKERIVFEKE